MVMRSLLVTAVCVAVSLSASAGISPGTGQTAANGGMDFFQGCLNDGRAGFVNDGKANNSVDFNGWCAVVWAELQWFDLVILDQYYAGPFAPYIIEVAYAVPEGWTKADGVADWAWTQWGATTYTDKSFAFSPGQEIAGVRFVRSEYLWHLEDPENNTMANFSRIREVWAFEHFSDTNLSSKASIAAWGGAKTTLFSDGDLTTQTFTFWKDGAGNLLSPVITVDFSDFCKQEDEPVTIDGFMITGGCAGELLGSFVLQYKNDNGAWVDACVVVNTAGDYMVSRDYTDFIGGKPITASEWQFVFGGEGPWQDSYVRVTEIMMFGFVGEVPEPATMTLLALGGLAMLRRRGR